MESLQSEAPVPTTVHPENVWKIFKPNFSICKVNLLCMDAGNSDNWYWWRQKLSNSKHMQMRRRNSCCIKRRDCSLKTATTLYYCRDVTDAFLLCKISCWQQNKIWPSRSAFVTQRHLRGNHHYLCVRPMNEWTKSTEVGGSARFTASVVIPKTHCQLACRRLHVVAVQWLVLYLREAY